MIFSLKNTHKLILLILLLFFFMSSCFPIFCFADGFSQSTGIAVTELSSEMISDNDIAKYAMQYVGCSYSWGSEDPQIGFDCSGFVYYVYLHFGVELPRTAQGQASCGENILTTDIQSGDILCFYSDDGTIYHSGIYIGDDKFIHADSTSGGVIISPISGYYADQGYEVRRITFN